MNATDIPPMLLWLLAWGTPLLISVLLAPRLLRPLAKSLALAGALPALLLAVYVQTDAVVEVPLLLGVRFGLTETTRLFLLFSAVLWLLAGLYARAYLRDDRSSGRFFGFFLVTMGGNLGLIVARDVIGFYTFFTLMSFASYGLIIHDGTRKALQAGRVYLILVVIGEALLLPAMILISAASGTYRLEEVPNAIAESPLRAMIFFLVLAGFGIKAGALPLHFWLPLAHPAAPTPASAVLSGAMIKAGLLGWLLFLPLGIVYTPYWGTLCIIGGAAAGFYGVAVGITQSNPKTVLAYSSISQMGWIMVAIGIGLLAPGAWPVALTAILVYAAHHAVAKSSLFLGVGVVNKATSLRARRLVFVGLLISALALAGAPLTSGAIAKYLLKETMESAPGSWPVALEALLQIGAIGTTLLMARFLFVIRPGEEPGKLSTRLWMPWAAQLSLVVIGIPMLPGDPLELVGSTLSFTTLWPLAAGAALTGFLWWIMRRTAIPTPRIPEGDILISLTRLLKLPALIRKAGVLSLNKRWMDQTGGSRTARLLERLRIASPLWIENSLRYWAVAGLMFLVLVLTLTLSGLCT